ncbi:MAG: glycosyltransferase [Candidatus Omnitrophica bacterium]|nr:glycosyltransferase [Candidatus Omnitrophota bacterium]
MKIISVGYHNPNFINSLVYREKAIEGMGHTLISFDDRDFIIPGRIRRKSNFLKAWDLARLNRKLIALAKGEKPDVCLVVGGQGVKPETVQAIAGMGTRIVLWTTDAPIFYSDTTETPRGFKNIIKAAPFYQHIFCAGTEAADIFRDMGLKDIEWLPFACDVDCHLPVELSEGDRKRYARDIAFVGSFYHNRARILESIYDMNIGVWGPHWYKLGNASPIKSSVMSGSVNYLEWLKIYNASKIVLVLHYNDGKTPCYQASPKLFEALACRSFVMVDDQKDAHALFEDGKQVVFFTDEADLRKKIEYYLKNPKERERIANAGYEEVKKKHTYEHRIERILDIVAGGG